MHNWSSRGRALASALALSLALSLAVACSDPATPPADDTAGDDAGDDTVIQFDTGAADGAVGGGDGAGGDGQGGDSWVWLTFDVDDSANKTFGDGDIKWTGSFAWDEKTNEIVFATSWLPTDGPYPLLYDDGPLSAGGHEHEGATKGDHVFSTAVKLRTSQELTLEYGALNEFDNWMWIGPNGQLKVAQGATGTLAAQGLKLPKHGDVDVKLVLDTDALAPQFATWGLKTHKFFVKGTMNMWTPVQLLDDGAKGDDKADDGKLTFVLSENLGKHDGLANAGDEVQFIFVTTTGDLLPEEGQEYKGSVAAMTAGVAAYTAAPVASNWTAAAVVLRKDSKGKFDNTAIIVPGGATCAPPCGESQICVAGTCKPKTADCSPACGDGQTCVAGVCQDKACEPACGTGQQCVKGVCQDQACAPACGAGQQCVKGVCQDKPCEPACGASQLCKGGVCQDKTCDPPCGTSQKCNVDVCIDLLALTAVDPKGGPMAGGTKITLTGKAFAAPALVRVGGAEASEVVVVSATQLTALTPKGKPGAAAVEVEVGGDKASLPDAFTYDAPPKPTALLVAPLAFAVDEGKPVLGLKAVVKVPTVSQASGPTEGLEVAFGYGPSGTLPNASPVDPKDAWTWKAATFLSEDVLKGEETWGVDLGVLPLGSRVFAVRATYAGVAVYGDSNGSEDGVEAAKLGTIAVTKPDLTPKVTGVEPAWLPTKGGTVTIVGSNLDDKTTVTLQSSVPAPPLKASAVKVTATGLLVTFTPLPGVPIPPRPASLLVKPSGAPETKLDNALAIVPLHTPKPDGEIGSDWDPGTLLAVNDVGSAWAGNSVAQLYAAYDADNLYIGVSGGVEAQNAVVVYVDVDYGAGTGAKSPLDLQDNSGALDDAIASKFVSKDAKFGMEFALGTLGMLTFSSGNASESGSVGWRSLEKIGDFAWLTAPVFAQAGKAVEGAIPLATLFPGGVPAKGTRVALVAVVVNKFGDATPTGGICPPQVSAGAAFEISDVAYFDLHPPPKP